MSSKYDRANRIVDWFSEKLDDSTTRLQVVEEIINSYNVLSAKIETLEQVATEKLKSIDTAFTTKNTVWNQETEAIKTAFNTTLKTLEELKTKQKTDLATAETEYTTSLRTTKSNLETLQAYYNTNKSSFDAALNNSVQINTTLTNNKSELSVCKKNWDTLNNDYKTKFEEHKASLDKIETESLQKASKILEELKKSEEAAKEVLDFSTSAGLAKFYGDKVETTKNNINFQKWVFIWANIGTAVTAIIATIFFVNGILNTEIVTNNYFEYISRFLIFVPITLPFIWIAKQNGELMRQNMHVLEEYEHKKSLVATFAGYKDSLIKTDIDTAKEKYILELIQSTTKGIIKNPADTLPKSKNEKMPLEEGLSGIIDVLKTFEDAPTSMIAIALTGLQDIHDKKIETEKQSKNGSTNTAAKP